jgi:cellulose synthase/poly-beta-1,6-N-acetylglucosamine synthase-like glycosyltransferase
VTVFGLALALIAAPVVMYAYAYALYPLGLLAGVSVRRLTTARRQGSGRPQDEEWPMISFSLPAYNEEATIAGALDALLAVDYPEDRRQILVTSDASDDRTDQIVAAYGHRGVQLLRLSERGGKTAAENESSTHLHGDIVVNTDASIRVLPRSVKPLVRALADPGVGVASGRDVSVGARGTEGNVGETGYVGYEMWVRSLESELGSIIGASGCFYATRRDLHQIEVPPLLSRDFAAVLKARAAGYRSVHVHDAVCLVPRTGSPGVEYRRKVRTISRGMDTLLHYRALLNPLTHGTFAIALASHKLCRWLGPLLLPIGLTGLVLAAVGEPLARWILALGVVATLSASIAVRRPARGGGPARLFAIGGYVLASNLACIAAWISVARGRGRAVWEPTRREGLEGDTA